MENLVVSFNVVFPIVLLMVVGALCRKGKILNPEVVKNINNFYYYVLVPSLVFRNVYTLDLGDKSNGRLLVFGIAAFVGICVFSTIFMKLVEKDNRKAGALVQCMFRSNYLLLGMAISISLYGEGNTAGTALLVSIIVPMYNIAAVVILEYFRKSTPNLRDLIWSVLKSPSIIAVIGALIIVLLKIRLPGTVYSVVKDLGGITTPLGLVVLGGSITIQSLAKYRKYILFGSLGKLVIIPGIVVAAAVFFGFKDEPLVAILGMTAAPISISCYPMADIMDSDGELTAQLIATTTIFSMFTLFLFVFVLKPWDWCNYACFFNRRNENRQINGPEKGS